MSNPARNRPLPAVWAVLAALAATSSAMAAVETDAPGDTFGLGAVQPDIVGVQGDTDGVNVFFKVTFSSLIEPPSSFASNSIVGFIDLDTDLDSTTGETSIVAAFAPGPLALGVEFYVDLGSEVLQPGEVDVVRASDNTIASVVPITFAASSFSLTIPLSVLDGDDGIMNYAVVTGTFSEPTDRAPNGEVPYTTTRLAAAAVPEPAALGMWSLGLCAVGFLRRRRRAC